jgi:hypothetical protein
MKNVTYAQKLLDLAEALEFAEIIDGEVYTMEDIKKLDEEKIVDLLEAHVIDALETDKHYPPALASNIDEIYKTYFSKEVGILDYIYDLSIED